MTKNQAISGVTAIRRALKDIGGFEYSIGRECKSDGWHIVVEIDSGCDTERIRIACPVDPTILRHVRETAERVAGPQLVAELPAWVRSAVYDLEATCRPTRARQLAFTLLGDLEAEEITAPLVNGLDSGVSLMWDDPDGECWLELWFPADKFCYHVRAQFGESDLSECVIVPGVRNLARGPVIATYPEYARGVLYMMFCDHEGAHSAVDADDVLRELGWWTEDEIAAIDDSAK